MLIKLRGGHPNLYRGLSTTFYDVSHLSVCNVGSNTSLRERDRCPVSYLCAVNTMADNANLQGSKS